MNGTTVFGEVDSIDFAVYLNKKAIDSGNSVNVTKIQKWLYICYGFYWAVHNKQLFHERPKAWDYGPVFPKVYNVQKRNKNSLDRLDNVLSLNELKKYDDVIQVTLKVFGDWTANELIAWTHESGKAWDKTILLEGKYAAMDNHDILMDFRGLFPDE